MLTTKSNLNHTDTQHEMFLTDKRLTSNGQGDITIIQNGQCKELQGKEPYQSCLLINYCPIVFILPITFGPINIV